MAENPTDTPVNPSTGQLIVNVNGTIKQNGTAVSLSGHTHTPGSIGAAAVNHGTHVSFSSTAPKMNGTASAGTLTSVARSDHIHPIDTSRAAASHSHSGYVPTTRKVNNKPLSGDISLFRTYDSLVLSSMWSANSLSEYPFYCTVSISGLTESDFVIFSFVDSYINTAKQFDVAPYCKVQSGGIELYAKTKPTKDFFIKSLIFSIG